MKPQFFVRVVSEKQKLVDLAMAPLCALSDFFFFLHKLAISYTNGDQFQKA